ncbi:hypothetical protein ACFYR1_19000 [Streptomyces canus]|uniref:hypothetical protein n=1 Tax=Streptomyces canus TaxID=58343 RepID=UPI003679BC2F
MGVRRVARGAEVAPALVLYYFRTLDDLFLAVLRQRGDEELERQARLLSGPQPLRALWRLSSHPGNALTTEFAALANHRKSIRTELAATAERYREAQLEALTRGLAERGTRLPPELSPPLHVASTPLADCVPGYKQADLSVDHPATTGDLRVGALGSDLIAEEPRRLAGGMGDQGLGFGQFQLEFFAQESSRATQATVMIRRSRRVSPGAARRDRRRNRGCRLAGTASLWAVRRGG